MTEPWKPRGEKVRVICPFMHSYLGGSNVADERLRGAFCGHCGELVCSPPGTVELVRAPEDPESERTR